jgi:hypothetical protein
MLLLSQGQTGEAWKHSKNQRSFGKRGALHMKEIPLFFLIKALMRRFTNFLDLDYVFLGCDAVRSDWRMPEFRIKYIAPSSVLKLRLTDGLSVIS